jgi:enoyl-CoA hydratase/carnithine racemase
MSVRAIRHSKAVAFIVMDNGAVNVLSPPHMAALTAALGMLEKDDDVKVVILTASETVASKKKDGVGKTRGVYCAGLK